MPTSELQRRLTRRHSGTQTRIKTAARAELMRIWRRTFDLSDLDMSWQMFSAQAMPVILANRDRSTEAAAAYVTRFRQAARVSGAATVVRAPAMDIDRMRRGLEYTGKIVVARSLARGMTPEQAVQRGMVASVNSAEQWVHEGGRETAARSFDDDPQSEGWQRVATSDDPCAFCLLMESRGPAYRSQSTAEFEAHVNCGCEVEGVYGAWEPTRRQLETDRLYRAATEDVRGTRPRLRAFESAYRESKKPALEAAS